jgi:glycosyltransferase involved in cell wall biosynthesis
MAMEELGIQVLALCPDPVAAEELANRTRRQAESEMAPNGLTRFKKVEMSEPRFRYLRPRRIAAIDHAIRHFRGIEDQVWKWEDESGSRVDAIFYACMYDRDFEWIHFARPFLRIPWTGLYLQAMSYRMPGRFRPGTRKLPCPGRMFGSRLCAGIGILDEGVVNQASNEIGKPVVALPDLADERPAANAEERMLGDRLTRFAGGRPIVGLFGHLQKSKGLMTLLEAARLPEASGICFALGGEMIWPSDEGEANRIRAALAEGSNLWIHLERIPSEPCLSGLMAVCDLLAAAYIDFPHSSGIQAKAAVLRKPLVVSDGYLMAERAKRFRTGEIVPQGDARALLEAIMKITKNPVAWVENNNPLWEDYSCEHSFERFKSNLGKLLASV